MKNFSFLSCHSLLKNEKKICNIGERCIRFCTMFHIRNEKLICILYSVPEKCFFFFFFSFSLLRSCLCGFLANRMLRLLLLFPACVLISHVFIGSSFILSIVPVLVLLATRAQCRSLWSLLHPLPIWIGFCSLYLFHRRIRFVFRKSFLWTNDGLWIPVSTLLVERFCVEVCPVVNEWVRSSRPIMILILTWCFF